MTGVLSRMFVYCAIALFLVACDAFPSAESSPNYFQGYEGIRMSIVPGSTPDRMYYYSDQLHDTDNNLMFNVEVQNTGSADSIGGIYVSGYDPNLIKMDGIIINSERGGWGDCDFGGMYSANDNWLANIGCRIWGNDVYTTVGQDGRLIKEVGGRVNFGSIIDNLPVAEDTKGDLQSAFGDMNLNFVVDTENDKQWFGVDWRTSDFDFSGTYNGRMGVAYITTLYGDLLGHSVVNHAHGQEYFLLGNRPTYPGGQQDVLVFTGYVDSWPRGLEQTEQIFMFTNCYVYTTYADPQICVDPYPDSTDNKVCTPKTITYPKGQGAPIAVTKIEQENTPREILFTIHIENKGRGQVFSPMSIHKCDPLVAERVRSTDLDQVFLMDVRIANEWQQLECPSGRVIRLDPKTGRGQVVCRYPIKYAVKSAYQTPLVLSFLYGYSDTMQKRVLIKRGN